MYTLPPIESGASKSGVPVDVPARYSIFAWRTMAVQYTRKVPELPIEAANEIAPAADEPNEFVFVGTVRNQGALLDVLNALIDRGLVIQSVRRLGQDDLLEPLCDAGGTGR